MFIWAWLYEVLLVFQWVLIVPHWWQIFCSYTCMAGFLLRVRHMTHMAFQRKIPYQFPGRMKSFSYYCPRPGHETTTSRTSKESHTLLVWPSGRHNINYVGSLLLGNSCWNYQCLCHWNVLISHCIAFHSSSSIKLTHWQWCHNSHESHKIHWLSWQVPLHSSSILAISSVATLPTATCINCGLRKWSLSFIMLVSLFCRVSFFSIHHTFYGFFLVLPATCDPS